MRSYLLYSVLGLGFSLTGCAVKESEIRAEPEGVSPGECTDGADNDFDGDYDCNDEDCSGSPDCLEIECDDGADNDQDGDFDCDDSDCADAPECATEDDCTDGADNDADGLFDCDDPDCAEDTACMDDFEGDEAGECTDGVDNDSDGFVDCDDSDCEGSPDCEVADDCYSIDFDGSGSMVNVSTPSEIMGSGTKYFGAWIYPRSVGNGFNGRTGIVGPTCCNNSGQHLDLIIGEDQTLAIDSNSGIAWSSIEIPVEDWSYVFAVWDSSAGGYHVGKVDNGNILKENLGSLAGNNIVANTISWGVYGQGFASNSADPSYFDGFMQAMMIRNDHPSDQDILMFASLDGINLNDNNLLSYLQPIGNETSLIEDQSNSNNDGIMSNASVSSNCVQQ